MLLKKNIPFKYVFGKIKYEIAAIAAYTVLIALFHFEWQFVKITIPLAVPAVLGTVISLLLGFRSNQAYDRWWEARHVWGAVVNDSRTLVRQILSFTHSSYKTEEMDAFQSRAIHRQIAWCFSLGRHLRHEPILDGLDGHIDHLELQRVKHIDNVPAALLDEMGRDLHLALDKGWINSYQQVELDRTLSRLCDSMGKCERIKNTVFPSTYSLYIHLSLLLFIGLLPFGVIEYFGLLEIPMVIAISACFLLIEKMAIHLQDPFENKPTDTPMTHIARSIEKDLMQLYKAHNPGGAETKMTKITGTQKPTGRYLRTQTELSKPDSQPSSSTHTKKEKPYYIL